MEEDKILIPTQGERNKFDAHIKSANNYRILFSGKYGSGKTYFLQQYFDINKDKYEVFHLFPTNYAVSSNEDIVKLLQFDILYEIICKGLIEKPEKMFSDKDLAPLFLINNAPKIIRDVVSHCGSIGKKLSEIFENSQDWLGKYDTFKQNMNKTDNDEVETTFQKLLSEFEYDATTELIELTLSYIENKQKVLIIDDLDRIDPEHIFRLLNVFSAQLSCYFSSHKPAPQDENRFGFDKVIFVCDIDNIRNIYHAKYGDKTDFLGYIDKFYSISPYSFNNNDTIAHEAYRFVQSIKTELPDYSKDILSSLTRVLLFHNVISLRQLVDKEGRRWEYPIRKYSALSAKYGFWSILLIDFVLFLFGTEHDASKALTAHKEEVDFDKLHENFKIADLLIPFLFDISAMKIDSEEEYKNEELNLRVGFICYRSDRDGGKMVAIKKIMNSEGNEKNTIPFFQLFAFALDNYTKAAEESRLFHY